MANAIELAVIGAGRMGAVHARHAAAHPGARLKYIVEPNAEFAIPLATELGAQVVELDVALADAGVVGVIVASSTSLHLPHSRAALSAGKAVFSEKPIGLDLGEARAAAADFPDGAPFILGMNRGTCCPLNRRTRLAGHSN